MTNQIRNRAYGLGLSALLIFAGLPVLSTEVNKTVAGRSAQVFMAPARDAARSFSGFRALPTGEFFVETLKLPRAVAAGVPSSNSNQAETQPQVDYFAAALGIHGPSLEVVEQARSAAVGAASGAPIEMVETAIRGVYDRSPVHKRDNAAVSSRNSIAQRGPVMVAAAARLTAASRGLRGVARTTFLTLAAGIPALAADSAAKVQTAANAHVHDIGAAATLAAIWGLILGIVFALLPEKRAEGEPAPTGERVFASTVGILLTTILPIAVFGVVAGLLTFAPEVVGVAGAWGAGLGMFLGGLWSWARRAAFRDDDLGDFVSRPISAGLVFWLLGVFIGYASLLIGSTSALAFLTVGAFTGGVIGAVASAIGYEATNIRSLTFTSHLFRTTALAVILAIIGGVLALFFAV